jgi:hypothetical protein
VAHQIELVSINQHEEEEWSEKFTAKTKSACRAKATRWINDNLFPEEIASITKITNQFTDSIEEWFLK